MRGARRSILLLATLVVIVLAVGTAYVVAPDAARERPAASDGGVRAPRPAGGDATAGTPATRHGLDPGPGTERTRPGGNPPSRAGDAGDLATSSPLPPTPASLDDLPAPHERPKYPRSSVASTSLAVRDGGPPRVEFVIADSETEQPISGARIVMVDATGQEHRCTTNSAGRGRIAHPNASPYVVRIHAPGQAPLIDAYVTLRDNRSYVLSGWMDPGIPLLGTVVDDASGKPVARASVVVYSATFSAIRELTDRHVLDRLTTGSDGTFRFDAVGRLGAVYVLVTAPERAAALDYENGDGSATASITREIRLVPGATIEGAVRTRSGAPVTDAVVFCWPTLVGEGGAADADIAFGEIRGTAYGDLCGDDNAWALAIRATSDRQGRFSLPYAHPTGALLVLATSPTHGLAEPRGPLAVAAGSTQRVDLVMQGVGSVLLDVRNESGDPVEGARIKTPYDDLMGRTEEVESGRYRIERLPAGQCEISVRHEAYESRAVPMHVEPDRIASGEVVLGTGLVFEARIVNDEDRPVVGAKIRCFAARGDLRDTVTSADGTFTLSGLPDGEFRLRVDAPGHAQRDIDHLTTATWPTTIRLARALRVRFRLVPPAKSPLPLEVGCGIRIRPRRGWREPSWHRDLREDISIGDDGRVTMTRVPPSSQQLRIVTDRYRAVDVWVTGAPGEEIDLGDLALAPPIRVRLRLTDEKGTPIAGADVASRSIGGLSRTGHADVGIGNGSTDAEGRLAFDWFLDGDFDVRVRLSDRANVHRRLSAYPGMGEVNLVAVPGARVRGRVVGQEMSRGPPVCVFHGAQTNGAEGGFRVESDGSFDTLIAPGRYTMFAGRDDARPQVVEIPEEGLDALTLTFDQAD